MPAEAVGSKAKPQKTRSPKVSVEVGGHGGLCASYSGCALSKGQCSWLSGCCEDFQHNIYKALGDPKQLFLMEVACAQDSVLSSEVEKQGLRAKRCSWWNNYDLSCNEGLKRLLQTVETERPRNLWISTECTAFSPFRTSIRGPRPKPNNLRTKERLIGNNTLLR